jgi:hypothetical protein
MVPGLAVESIDISDCEFMELVSGDERLFAVRQRADQYAGDLRVRVSTVAADLRRLIVAETVQDPLTVMRVADHLEYLANELEAEVGRMPAVEPPRGKRRRPDNVTFLKY